MCWSLQGNKSKRRKLVDKKCPNENQREMEKTFKSRKVKIDDIYESILNVQEEKLVADESIEVVELWGNEVTEHTYYVQLRY